MKGCFFICIILLVFLGECQFKPTFPPEPKIKFNSIKKFLINNNGDKKDSIVIAIDFQDGDGDLGLNTEETNAPYNEFNGTTPNEFFYNYYVSLLRRNNGKYELVDFGGPTLNGRYPLLNKDLRKTPLEGIIRRGIDIRATYPRNNDTVKFQVQIADRALNKSNIILTDSIIINVKN